jgi:hypothetical protein
VQTYERLAEDLKLRKLEAQLHEVKQQASILQAQLKLLTVVEKMKRSQEKKYAIHKKVTAIQSIVMEVTQRLQLV